ncbi:MAG: tetratricopeptide repeat protein [Anaerolineae bacterium]|nr:tetratricopeptide repeat protein [Anaerolineae bacterium]
MKLGYLGGAVIVLLFLAGVQTGSSIGFSPPAGPTLPTLTFVPAPTPIPAGDLTAGDHYHLAEGYYGAARYEEALAAYTQAIELSYEPLASAYLGRGMVYHDLGDYKAAIADYDLALELDPDFAEVYYRRGRAYSYLEEHRSAFLDATRTIELDPAHARAYNLRGVALDFFGQYALAVEDYTRAIELGHEPAVWPYYNRGLAYKSLGEYRLAAADFDTVITLTPGDAAAHNERGIAYDELGDHEQAIEDYTQAIALGHDPLSWPYTNRGWSYLDQGMYVHAAADFNAAIALDDMPNAYWGLGDIYYMIGQYRLALVNYRHYLASTTGEPSDYVVDRVRNLETQFEDRLL